MKKRLLINGDCLKILKRLPENSVDAVVTDPPAGIAFMGKDWDDKGDLFGFQEFIYKVFKKVIKVIKPGGHCLVWALPRTSHHTAMGLERAGFEIRDCIYHIFGSGFPKSLNIGKAIDKLQGNERKILGKKQHAKKDFKDNLYAQDLANRNNKKVFGYGEEEITKGNSPFEGYGTALKPAVECWWLARKPLSEKIVAENCLKWGTGGINIDGCRVGTDIMTEGRAKQKGSTNWGNEDRTNGKGSGFKDTSVVNPNQYNGRFPANFIHDGSDEVVKLFPNTSKQGSRKIKNTKDSSNFGGGDISTFYGDQGSAARFFYCAKASKKERDLGCKNIEVKSKCDIDKMGGSKCSMKTGSGNERNVNYHNNHPTVKPLSLMKYLVQLTSRKNQIVLDPFMGSGTTGIACRKLKRRFIGIEEDKDYFKIAKARINYKDK